MRQAAQRREGPRADSFQSCILRLGLLQDGDVGVGVFPEREEILIRRHFWLRKIRVPPGRRNVGMAERSEDLRFALEQLSLPATPLGEKSRLRSIPGVVKVA